jgi:hypothetical protein
VSNPTAKELLAQADQLMRRARPADDLPVLTELVRDPESLPPTLEDRIEEEIPVFTFDDMDLPEVDAFDTPVGNPPQSSELPKPALVAPVPPPTPNYAPAAAPIASITPVAAPIVAPTWTSASPVAMTAAPTQPSVVAPVVAISDPVLLPVAGADALYTRQQFDAMLATKLEEVQHSVYSQVMQQLELHTTGRMRENLRAALAPTVQLIVDEITSQVADETAIQMQSVVANAVDAELARLREQLSKKRDSR